MLAVSGPVYLSQTTGANGGTLSILAPATSSLSATGIVSLSTNGSTISVGAPAYSGGFSTMGNTAGDTGYASQRLNLAGGANITLSGSTNGGSMTVTISGGAGGGGDFSAGMSTEGNTAGNTGVTGTPGSWPWGSGPIYLSQTTGRRPDGTYSLHGGGLDPAGHEGLQISSNGSTISIGDGGNRTMADWQNMPQGEAQLQTLIAGISKTPFYWHEVPPGQPHGQLPCVQGVVRDGEYARFPECPPRGLYLRELDLDGAARLPLRGVRHSSASSASFSGVRNLVMTGIGRIPRSQPSGRGVRIRDDVLCRCLPVDERIHHGGVDSQRPARDDLPRNELRLHRGPLREVHGLWAAGLLR